jgi:hypothetical protein
VTSHWYQVTNDGHVLVTRVCIPVTGNKKKDAYISFGELTMFVGLLL